MTFVSAATAFAVLMLVVTVVVGWVAELRRSGGAISARESRAAAERTGRQPFYTSREDRAEAMRERIRRERRRRERARAASGAQAGPSASRPSEPPPRAERPTPDDPETRHRQTLELDPGPVTAHALRQAYRRLVAAYHPDRVAGLGAKLQRLAEEETKSINEAYAFFKTRVEG